MINAARMQYRPIAVRGMIIYFVIADLANIGSMYQFSLNYFLKIFNMVLVESEQSDVIEKRIEILIRCATETLYLSVCRGLFNDHRRIYSFLLSAEIQKDQGAILASAWNYFLKGIGFSNVEKIPPKPAGLNCN